jgi:hypothetical protein
MNVVYEMMAWELVKARRAEIERAAERASLERTVRPRKRRAAQHSER